MTRRAMLGVHVASGFGRGLRARRRGTERKRADEHHAQNHGSANTKIELCPRTALAMLVCVRLSGPDDTDWPSPVKIITYCLPFTAYVMVLFITMPATIVSHSTCPLSASKARKRRFMSPQNTRSPAVTSAEPCPACGCEWRIFISPVATSILARFMNLSGSMPGRITPARGPQPAFVFMFAVIDRHWSWNGT